MEIHAPSHPLKTIREFLSHIFVVTVGILIALWFDGIREHIHDRSLVQEARENFRLDIDQNREHLKSETKSLDEAIKATAMLLEGPGRDGTAVLPQVAPAFYFFRSTSWDTALSTGALAHMKATEVVRYADMHDAVKTYGELERVALGVFVDYVSLDHQSEKSPEMTKMRRDRLLILQQNFRILRHLADELSETIDQADKATRQNS